MPRVKVGCCGLPRGMKDYFIHFRLVEVQQTFYKMAKLETALRWRQQAPSDFEFTIKAWQLITHSATSPTYRIFAYMVDPVTNIAILKGNSIVLKNRGQGELCSGQ